MFKYFKARARRSLILSASRNTPEEAVPRRVRKDAQLVRQACERFNQSLIISASEEKEAPEVDFMFVGAQPDETHPQQVRRALRLIGKGVTISDGSESFF